MTFFEAVILGIVQGLTEFLPVSSTAHLRIMPSLLRWEDPGTAFSAVIQIGTVFSVILYFWKDLKEIYGAMFSEMIFERKVSSKNGKLGLWILFGTIPICIFGLLFKKPIEEGMVRDLNIVSFYLIFFGILLLISEIIAKQNRKISDINALDILLIGLAQVFALIPGVSRAAVTLLAGLMLGFKRADAARFSFLLSVPAILASGSLELYTLFSLADMHTISLHWMTMLGGILSAFIFGYFAIDFLLKFLQVNKTHVFVVYRVLLGVLIFLLHYKGIIK